MKTQIKNYLLSQQDLTYQKFSQKLLPGISNIIGIKIPILRKYAKELVHKYEISYLLNIIDDQYFEELMLKGIIIGYEKNIDKVTNMIYDFVPLIDNWSTCDSFVSSLKITINYKEEMWPVIVNALTSKHEYSIRFGIVMLINYYLEVDKIPIILEILKQVHSNYYYVNMALSWIFSMCLVVDFDYTFDFLNTSVLDQWILKKTICKANDSFQISQEQKIKMKKLL